MRVLPMLLIWPLLPGCLASGYPSLTQTPPITVREPDVKVFRHLEQGRDAAAAGVESHSTRTLTEIVPVDGQIPSFDHFHFAYHLSGFKSFVRSDHSDTIRLYRRGFETTTVDARCWPLSALYMRGASVTWKEAKTLWARENAIHQIYASHGDLVAGTRVMRNYAPAEFIAAECEALAHSPLAAGSDNAKARARLLKKVERIRRGDFDLGDLDRELDDSLYERQFLRNFQLLPKEGINVDYRIYPSTFTPANRSPGT